MKYFEDEDHIECSNCHQVFPFWFGSLLAEIDLDENDNFICHGCREIYE